MKFLIKIGVFLAELLSAPKRASESVKTPCQEHMEVARSALWAPGIDLWILLNSFKFTV